MTFTTALNFSAARAEVNFEWTDFEAGLEWFGASFLKQVAGAT